MEHQLVTFQIFWKTMAPTKTSHIQSLVSDYMSAVVLQNVLLIGDQQNTNYWRYKFRVSG